MADLFEILDSITFTKVDATRGENGEDNVRTYDPFIIVQALSQHVDTILYANEMNKHPLVSKQMHFDYLFNSIRSKRRRGKWAKKSAYDDLDVVMRYYGYSKAKAVDALKVLTKEQIDDIKQRMNVGGRVK